MSAACRVPQGTRTPKHPNAAGRGVQPAPNPPSSVSSSGAATANPPHSWEQTGTPRAGNQPRGSGGVLARGHEAPKTPGKARRLRRSVAVLLGGGMGSTTAAKPASAGDVITVSRAPSSRQRGSGLSGRGGGSSSSCWAPAPAAQGRGERKKG